MSHRMHAIVAILSLLVAVMLTACASTEAASPSELPVVVEALDGSEISRLTLSTSAAERLDIQTTEITSNGTKLVAPSAAVIIDPDGIYWVYTNPTPLVFVREEIRPVTERGGQAFYDTGPPAGSAVVTVGVPELYGAEFGIGK